MKRFLILVLTLLLGSALAEPVSVQLELPAGLKAGDVPVTASVAGLEGAKLSVAVDPGDGLAAREVALDNGYKGVLKLDGISEAAQVTVKLRQGGRNFAATQLYTGQNQLTFVMEEPRSRVSAPYSLLPWLGLIVVLGFLAIRGAQSAF